MHRRHKMPIRKELETITDLEAGARVVPAGSDLYRQGDVCSNYFIVLNGWIALAALLDDGSCQILDFAVRPEGAYHQWRKDPSREWSMALVADERFGRATGWIEAS